MELIHVTSFLLVSSSATATSAKPSSSHAEHPQPSKRTIDGLRALHALASNNYDEGKRRDLQNALLSGPGAGGLDCGDTCTDDDECTSFMATGRSASDPASVLEGSCNAGCIPEVALSTCKQYCGDDEDAAPHAAVTAEQRQGLGGVFDSPVDLLCGNCKFYQCCVGGFGDAKYDSCKEHLPEDADSSDDWGFAGLGDFPDIGSLLPDDWQLGDLPDVNALFSNLGDLGSALIPDKLSELADAVSGGIGDTAGIPGLDGLLALDCPDTCTKKELCGSGFPIGAMDVETLEEACDIGCLPVMDATPCEQICNDPDFEHNGFFWGAVADIECDSCKFLECCAGGGFATCQDFLPDMGNVLPEIDWDTMQDTLEWNSTIDWGAILDWSGMELATGLTEVVDSLHLMFDEAFASFDSFPVTCNSETCSIDGLCDLSVDLASVDFEDACTKNVLFDCAEGLETMCANECKGGSVFFLSAGFCSLCNMAECCKDATTSFEDCALGAVQQAAVGAIEEISDALPSQLGVGPVSPVEDFASEPLDTPVISVESLDSSPSDLTPEDSSESSTGAPIEAPSSESNGAPVTPAEDSASQQLNASSASAEPSIEMSRFTEPDPYSASHVSEISMSIALASIAAFVFAI